MALDQAANFVREQVTSAISAGDTTINVADASPFPVPPEGYNIVVWDGGSSPRPDQDPDVEIMRVTDTDTTNDTLTVARGQEGTSDVSHPDTSVVVVAQTAKMIADIASEKISNPVTETVNVDGNDVTNVGALDADEAVINQRDIVSQTDETITVGTDTSTIQEAVDQALLVSASVTIDIPDGTYAENVSVPVTNVDGNNIIIIQGNQTNIGNVKVNSMIIGGGLGKRPFSVRGIEFTSTHPDSDGPSSLQVNDGTCSVLDCAFSDSNNNRAMSAYGGTLITKNTIDVGTDNYSSAIVCKNVGSVETQNAIGSGDIVGSTTSTTFSQQNGNYFGVDRQLSVTGSPYIKAPRGTVFEFTSANLGKSVPYGLAGIDGEGIEFGTVTHNDPGTAASADWGDAVKDNQTVTFDREFAQSPKIFIQAGPGDTARGVMGINSVTTTDFVSEWWVHRTDSSSGTTAQWWAIGPR